MAINKAKMKCNKPRRTPDGPKKFVVKACQDGTEKIIRYGDPNMKIRKSNPKSRKSFRARHTKTSRPVVSFEELSKRAKKKARPSKN